LIFVAAILVAFAFYFFRPFHKARRIQVRADKLLLEKSKHELALLNHGRVVKTYRVALGSCPIGRKEREGDGRTPEGNYVIDFHKPDSDFHRALHISYPNTADLERACAAGVSAGSDIMIHGSPNGLGAIGSMHRLYDWTAGCVAVTNDEIEEIYAAVTDGTPIEIRP
jgi:murein L,D-transpeptidase YafK